MSAHTPGPWTVFAEEPGGRNVGIEADAIPFSVIVWGESHESDQGVQGRTRDEMLANARLIAAAPDLLAALDALIKAVEREDNPRDEGLGSEADEMTVARAAIQSATGAAK